VGEGRSAALHQAVCRAYITAHSAQKTDTKHSAARRANRGKKKRGERGDVCMRERSGWWRADNKQKSEGAAESRRAGKREFNFFSFVFGSVFFFL
jgi:hypothetical protein